MGVSGEKKHREPGEQVSRTVVKPPKLLWQDPSMQFDHISLTSCLPPSPDGREID